MTWLVRKVLHLDKPPVLLVTTRPQHVATLARADRLLRLVEQYRAADAKRHHQ